MVTVIPFNVLNPLPIFTPKID